MEIRSLLYFIEVAKQQSYSKAAARLYITQQALSKSIKLMEAELNEELFVKGSMPLELTPFGKAAFPIFEQMLSNFDSGMEKIQSIHKDGVVPLRIAAAYQAVESVNPTLLDDFTKAYPKIHLDYRCYPDLLAEEAVEKGNADFGFIIGKSDSDLLTCQLLKRHPLGIMVNKHHPLAVNRMIHFRDLNGYQLYCAGRLFKTWSVLNRAKIRYDVDVTLIETSGYLVKTFMDVIAKNQIIITLMDSPENSQDLYKDAAFIGFYEDELNWDVYLAYRREMNMSNDEKIFFHHMYQFGTKE